MNCGKFVPPPMLKPRRLITGAYCRWLASGFRALAIPVGFDHLTFGSISHRLAAQPTLVSLNARLLRTRVNVPCSASAYLSKLTELAGWLVAPPIVPCVPSIGW